MKRKNVLKIVFVLLFVVIFVIPTQAADTYNWKIGHIRPENSSVHKDCQWLKEQLNQRSNGRIKLNIYPANQLGDYTVVQERVSVGAIEMNLACLSSERNPKIQIVCLPYLVKDWEEAKKIYGPDSIIVKEVKSMLRKQNINIISSWPVYFGGIGTTKAIAAPGNPDLNQETKIRVPSHKVYTLVSQELGFQTAPIAWSDTYSAMQTGIVDGIIGGGGAAYYANLRDLIKYYYPYNDHLEIWFLYMNQDLWESLSKEDQKLVMTLGRELEARRWEKAEKEEKETIEKMKEYGIEVINLTDDELSKCQSAVRQNVWPELKEEIGEELLNKIIK